MVRSNFDCARKPPRRIARAAAFTLALFLAACSRTPPGVVTGYAEGDFLYLSAASAGLLTSVSVQRGRSVQRGELLFTQDSEAEEATLKQTEAQWRAAEAQWENLRGPRRASEIEALQAQQAQAEAALKLSQAQLRQQEELGDFTSQAKLDEVRAAHERDRAALAQIQAQLKTAQESLGRAPEIAQALANRDAIKAQLAQARWRLAQRRGEAPEEARVQDVFLRGGEYAAAGAPILSLFVPARLRLRFYVPEEIRAHLLPGQPVHWRCDGCAGGAAQISFISPQAEYTPPVLYGRESRTQLVYLIEAKPEAASALLPGQPVDIVLVADEP